MLRKYCSNGNSLRTGLKIMAVAAAAGFAFAGQNQAKALEMLTLPFEGEPVTWTQNEITGLDNFIQEEDYGTVNGVFEKYYKYEDSGNGYYRVVEATGAEDANFSVKYGHPNYDWENPVTQSLSTNTQTITQDDINNKVFEGITNGHGFYNNEDNGDLDLNADFIDNSPNAAFYNYKNGVINDVNGDFVDNDSAADGRDAIMNRNTIHNINGTFLNNTGSAIDNIYEAKSIENINGTFVNNSGKTIINQGTKSRIENINGLFIGNKGNTIYNTYKIGNINGTFIGNETKDYSNEGAAIYNRGTLENVEADFYGNHSHLMGGAISNRHKINALKGNFIGNTAGYTGGAIYNNNDSIINVEGNFKNNRAGYLDMATDSYGGAITNYHGEATVKGNFEDNLVIGAESAKGGAIFNNGTLIVTDSTFKNNSAVSNLKAEGGAIKFDEFSARREVSITNSKFENNHVLSNLTARGGAVFAETYVGAPSENSDTPAEAPVPQTVVIPVKLTNVSFTNNYAKSLEGVAQGGAIYARNALDMEATDGYTSKISGNYVEDANGKRQEGIYLDTTMELVNSEKLGKVNIDGTERSVYQDSVDTNLEVPTLTLNANNNGVFVIDDQIVGSGKVLKAEYSSNRYYKEKYEDPETGEEVTVKHYINAEDHETENPEMLEFSPGQSKLKIKGDDTGKIYINNDVKALHIDHNDVTTYVGKAGYLNQPDALNSLTMNSGTINIKSMSVAPLHFENFAMNGGTINIDSVDVDLANKKMGRITADNYANEAKGTINVKGMKIVSDAKDVVTPVEFADKSFKNTVKTEVKEAYTPIYKYDVEYDTEQKYGQETEDGYFVFKRSDRPAPVPPSPKPDDFNPSVLVNDVVAQAGGGVAMTHALSFAFEHCDTFMNNAAMDRFAMTHDNVYALSSDYNENLGHIDYSHENNSVWVKPYSTFENVRLKNGPKVDAISYGTLIGFDSKFHKLGHGWYNVGTGYIGYNGSQIDYKGVDASTNGGLLGVTETFYKGNFWTALTATVGASGAEAHTMYGKDDIAVLMAGVGSKSGYNFEFADGRFIVQPRMFVAYSMVNTFDYTNAAGVRIDSDPLHTIQINPALRFIGNTKNGWQPYASVGMVWNLLNETETTADGVKLPEMHTKPYVEYGLGVQKLWNDKYSAYGQAMVRNGGRTGVALTLGFRMALGEDGKPIERTQAEPDNSTITAFKGFIK